MSIAALGEVGVSATNGQEPIVAAAERVQQLQALIAQVEQPSTGTSFAATLDAAQGTAGAPTANSESSTVYTDSSPASSVYPTGYTDASPASGAYSNGYADPSLTAYTTAPTTSADALPSGTGEAMLTSAGASTGGLEGSAYVPLIEQAAAHYGINPSLLYGLIEQESGFDPAARSSAGALGLTQLMPGTAASLGVSEPLNPTEAIAGGARFLAQLLGQFGGNTADALAAYNAGPGAVQQYGGVPPYPETEQYVSKVLGTAAAYEQSRAGEVRT
jgi:soluble lytic murein transglycosylase-like protein